MRRRNKLIIVTIIFFIVSVINIRYFEELFNELFFIYLPVLGGIFVSFNICMVHSILWLKKNHASFRDFIPINILISIVFLCFFSGRIRGEQQKNMFMDERNEIVEMIKGKELIANSGGKIELSEKDKALSTGGEIIVYQNDHKNIMIGFWDERTLFNAGFSMYVYTSDDDSHNIEKTINCIEQIERISEYWYYISGK